MSVTEIRKHINLMESVLQESSLDTLFLCSDAMADGNMFFLAENEEAFRYIREAERASYMESDSWGGMEFDLEDEPKEISPQTGTPQIKSEVYKALKGKILTEVEAHRIYDEVTDTDDMGEAEAIFSEFNDYLV